MRKLASVIRHGHPRRFAAALLSSAVLFSACSRPAGEKVPELSDAVGASSAATEARAKPLPADFSKREVDDTQVRLSPAARGPEKVDFQAEAMDTKVHFVAYTNDRVDALQAQSAMSRAFGEIERLAGILSEWRSDSEVGQINRSPGQWVKVSPEAFAVISRGLEAGRASKGAFDITFQAMSGLWKFGSAAEEEPKVPSKSDIEQRRRFVDYRKVELASEARAVRISQGQQIGLGGIAKGYIVDRAADVLKEAGIQAFLVQAGGDLFGAGRKPDGSPWISGIRDPRGADAEFFATIELTDHAFSTAGDYARSFVIGNRRYHHIIDPHTGYPATACRSVTVWADDATTADAIDDAVFIMGPERGLELVEASPGVGVVIVDENNKVWVSARLAGKVHVTHPPTNGI